MLPHPAGCVKKGKEDMAVRPPDFPDLFRAPGGVPAGAKWMQPAFVRLPSAAAQAASGGSPPGDGLSHPEQEGAATHKAFSEFWVQRHGGEPPLPNCAAALENRIDLGLHPGLCRCWLASAGAGRRSNAYSLGEFWVQRHAGGQITQFWRWFFSFSPPCKKGKGGFIVLSIECKNFAGGKIP